MPSVEILEVAIDPLDSERLWGRSIDVPVQATSTTGYSFSVAGWVLGRLSRPATVEVMHLDRPIRGAPVVGIRPDVAAHYPQVPAAEICGFQLDLGVLGLRPEFCLRLEAVLEDSTRVPLGTIRGFHQPLRSGFQSRIQPLMVSTMGRTGSTLLMRQLAAHPQIVVDTTYPYETRAASYWMHMLRVLSEPANHFQSTRATDFHSNLSWVGHHPFFSAPTTNNPEILSWFKSTYPERLAAFCQRTIEEFYEQLAHNQGRSGAAYFAEKYHNGYIPWLVWEIYAQAREVVLVRDLRDMLCSMLAFNAKQGTPGFGRHRANSDEEYVHQLGMYASRLYERWKRRSDRACLIKYEDLVLRPAATLKGLIEYLALDYSPSIIESMIRAAREETAAMQHHRTTAAPEASIGRWRRDLDSSLLSVCQEAFGDVLKNEGYESA